MRKRHKELKVRRSSATKTYRKNPATGKMEWMSAQVSDPGEGEGSTPRGFRPYTSRTLPLNYKYHRGGFDEAGRCVFQTQGEQFETLKRAQDAGEPLDWDY